MAGCRAGSGTESQQKVMRDRRNEQTRMVGENSVIGINRRDFLSKSAAAGIVAGASSIGLESARASKPLVDGMPNTEKLGWRVGFATYSFRSVTIHEAIEKTAATGLRYAELFAWQKLSPAEPEATPE